MIAGNVLSRGYVSMCGPRYIICMYAVAVLGMLVPYLPVARARMVTRR